MGLEVYWGSGSPVSWRVLLTLALKKLPFESHRLDVSAGDNKTPEYLAMNPRGTFPVLRDQDVVVRDSLAILVYLERAYPEPSLLGHAPAEAAHIWQWIAEHDSGLGAAAQTITRGLFRKKGVVDPAPFSEAIESMHRELAAVETHLESRDWLVGQGPTGAEVVFYPTVHRLLRAATRDRPEAETLQIIPLAKRYPRVQAWTSRLAQRPGVEETYPPHWR